MKKLTFEELPAFEMMLFNLGTSTGIDCTYKILGEVRATLSGYYNRNYFVDQFPNFTAAVSIIEKGKASEEAETKFLNRYVTCYSKSKASLKQLMLDVIDEIQWDKPLTISASPHFIEAVQDVIEVKRKTYTCEVLSTLDARLTDLPKFNLPDGYLVSSLKESEAALIAQAWPYSSDETETFLRWLIKNFCSLAIRTENGSLVAYMIQRENGSLGYLRVIPEHRRKGLAQYVVTELTRKTIRPRELAYVFVRNDMSYNLHTRCGFKKVMDYIWVYID